MSTSCGWEGKGRYGSFRCGWTCGCAGKTVKSLENTRHISPERFCGGDSLRRGAISSICTFTLPLPAIRRAVASRRERSRQIEDPKHPLYRHCPARQRLQSRKSFVNSVLPLTESPEVTRLALMETTTTGKGTLYNSVVTREGTATTGQHKWLADDVENAKSTTVCRRQKSFVYGKMWLYQWHHVWMRQSEQTVQHMQQCQLLDKLCSIQDLEGATETAMMYVNKWKKTIWRKGSWWWTRQEKAGAFPW